MPVAGRSEAAEQASPAVCQHRAGACCCCSWKQWSVRHQVCCMQADGRLGGNEVCSPIPGQALSSLLRAHMLESHRKSTCKLYI